jgi:hypothetical protein
MASSPCLTTQKLRPVPCRPYNARQPPKLLSKIMENVTVAGQRVGPGISPPRDGAAHAFVDIRQPGQHRLYLSGFGLKDLQGVEVG